MSLVNTKIDEMLSKYEVGNFLHIWVYIES